MSNIRFVLSVVVVLILASCTLPHKKSALTWVQEDYHKIYGEESDLAVDILFPKNNLAVIAAYKTLKSLSLNDLQSHIFYSANQDDGIAAVKISDDRSRMLVLNYYQQAEIFNTADWSSIKTYTMRGADRLGISGSGKLVNVFGQILDADSGNSVLEYAVRISPISYDYSSDDRYFVEAGIHTGALIVDLTKTSRGSKVLNKRFKGTRKVTFIDNDLFYIDEGAKTNLNPDDEYPKKLNIASASSRELISSYKPRVHISCWTKIKGTDHIAMALINGDLLILNKYLEPLERFSLDARAELCVSGNNGQLWFGTQSKGVLHLDLNNKTLSNPVKLSSPIVALTLSDNGQYLGVIEHKFGEGNVLIYKI